MRRLYPKCWTDCEETKKEKIGNMAASLGFGEERRLFCIIFYFRHDSSVFDLPANCTKTLPVVMS